MLLLIDSDMSSIKHNGGSYGYALRVPWVRLTGTMGTPYGYHMSPNRVRTSMKRGTPPMTHNFWAYGTVVKQPLQ